MLKKIEENVFNNHISQYIDILEKIDELLLKINERLKK